MDILVIPIYNRPVYLNTTLASLAHALDKEVTVILADDGSTDREVDRICKRFIQRGLCRTYHWRHTNLGVAYNMKHSIERALGLSDIDPADSIITLDSDFLVKPDFLQKLRALNAKEGGADTIITGFNAITHPIIQQLDGYAVKRSIGGGNLCLTVAAYHCHLKAVLVNAMWDWNMCISISKAKGRLLCVTPSVSQHIGMQSVMNHPKADVAMDFNL